MGLRTTSAYIRTVRPALPVPDSAYQRLLASKQVKRIAKVSIDDEGQLGDTVAYQEFDQQGHLLRAWTDSELNSRALAGLAGIYSVPVGAYQVVRTSAVSGSIAQPTTAAPTASSAAPAPAAPPENTLLTYEQVPMRSARGGNGFYHRFTYTPNPDTVLYLQYSSVDTSSKLSFSSARYRVLRQGRPAEQGRIAARAALKPARRLATNPAQSMAVAFEPLLGAVRRGQNLDVLHRWRYDAQQRLLHEQTNTRIGNGAEPQILHTEILYTYNSLGQLIGRRETVSSVRIPPRTSYTVYAYLPEGLIKGETTTGLTGAPRLFRYQYEYYR
ncbi:hypothetical protein [Hymenobacter latericus]|uniref:hypothetical protein n=1 Tax=Hymenobacter sp. YIM 151858-1 TaxID=2987688 RepID=UPI002227A564|nr:hypothetical protein [Hymenobacter sp. YIM 151858-1]UYZ58975.1 hypothetical protein OIS50_18180 [Hymenobacter sp. YIM 151858-1]